MKSNIFGTGNRRSVNPDWFTDKVWMKEVSGKIASKEQDIYHVHFLNGARTKLHSHNGAQILIVVDGSGSLVTYERNGTKKPPFKIRKTKTTKLNRGDITYIPSGTLHTHGSVSKNKEFSHIAINILPMRKSKYGTQWFESDFESTAYGKI